MLLITGFKIYISIIHIYLVLMSTLKIPNELFMSSLLFKTQLINKICSRFYLKFVPVRGTAINIYTSKVASKNFSIAGRP